MTTVDRKQLIRDYKAKPRQMGVYRVHNAQMRKSLIGSSTDVPSMLNRLRFQLENGLHTDRALQADWNAVGSTGFEFEVLDQLQAKDEPSYDPRDDLSVLRDLWIEKVVASGETLYQQPDGK